jgi:ubiquitin-activating enzyme E1
MLQGVGGLTIIDPRPTKIADVGCNFFLTESDAEKGTPRADAVLPRLMELNPMSTVSTAPDLTEELIEKAGFKAVVITDPSFPKEKLFQLNEFCRARNIGFFYNVCGGFSTSIFVDLGDNHIIFDPNGEKPMTKIITNISPLEDGEFMIRYETPEGQQPSTIDDGYFELSDIIGAGEAAIKNKVNGLVLEVTHSHKDPVKTIRCKFPDDIASNFSYESGGILTEKKQLKRYPMMSLAQKLVQPGNPFMGDMVLTNLIDIGSELQQHMSLVSMLAFLEEEGRLPMPNSKEDAAKMYSLAKSDAGGAQEGLGGADFEASESFITQYALLCAIELQPMAAFTGGVLAQEVVKCSGKFTPIPGWLHFSCKDALRPAEEGVSRDITPRNSRYDNLAAVYGWDFVEKLGNLKYFMVGCGALGCEFLKNFALNGVCCGKTGHLTVTDADRIELSNLSRQFLFREHNVGQPKSRAAGVMARQMNNGLTVNSLEMFVGPKTETHFNDEFWMGLDGVCNALDNMEARLYVDSQCVRYEKSLLESGTMGTSGNTDTISPFKTRIYADGGAAAEGGGVPMCTLRNFPHLTDHCIEWSRDQFELFFVKLPKSVLKYLEDPDAFENEKRTLADAEPGQALFETRCVNSLMSAAKTPTVGSAAQVAFDLFHYLFRDKILDLQAAFPRDYRVVDKDTGADKGPFWSEKKRYPTAAEFNVRDQAHLDFMISATCLFGVALGIFPAKKDGDNDWLKQCREDPNWILNIIEGLTVPEYVGAPVSTDDDIATAADSSQNGKSKDDRSAVLDSLLGELRVMSSAFNTTGSVPPMDTADFEKDDDFNFHIAFITAACNLRCDNYTIKRSDFQQVKIVAGKIIAAIATTTAAVCGLVVLELFKLAFNAPTDSLMSRMIGLAVNTYTTFSQDPPKEFESRTETTAPPPDTPLPADAYDDKGALKDEYLVKTEFKAYPEKHTVWDKLTVAGSLTLTEFASFLAKEHGLELRSWSMVVGTKNKNPVTSAVYPPKPKMDMSLLPSLDLTMQQATMAIMRTPTAKPTQSYIQAWKAAKANGALPEVTDDADVITGDTTLADMLMKMATIGDTYLESGKIDTPSITDLPNRKMWVIPGDQAPSVRLKESGEDIEYFSALKITLDA